MARTFVADADMFRPIARLVIGALAVTVVVAVAALGYRAWRQHENAQMLAITRPNGIDEAQFVHLGGIDQWIRIRGEDRSNPVLLVLAGGPGNSLIPLTSVFRSWESQFTVVQWDQRGAGKTYGRNGIHEDPMTIERMRDDGVELTQYLLERLDKPKLVLLGHSWGTVLGVMMVKAHPELYYAYVGTGQVVGKEEKEEILYAALMEKVRRANDDDGVAKLTAIGAPPYKSQADLLVEREVSERYDIAAERDLEETLRPVVLFAPDFSMADIYSMLQGSTFAANALYREVLGYDARRLGLDFAVPFFVFNGDRDLVTPADLAAQYVATIDAPQKQFVTLEGGGHSAMLTMADVFLNELVARVRPLAVH
jgi:pimeloyl-ACP methyl ester carboxylesterase